MAGMFLLHMLFVQIGQLIQHNILHLHHRMTIALLQIGMSLLHILFV